MELGLIGLGKMGGPMRQRLRDGGHTVIGFDRNPEVTDAADLASLVAGLNQSPRVIWVMVPAAVVDPVLIELAPLLAPGDIVIDGGNSHYADDAVRAARLGELGLRYLDCGVSGGVWGLELGYALMVGGDADDVATVQPIFDALKPEGEHGFVHAGSHGAGHFAKMVHNGIEYGMMQSYAEGWELLETAELIGDVPAILRSWTEGSVIRSWLLDLMVAAVAEDEHLSRIAGHAADSGEGRWTVKAGIDLGVAMPAIAASVFARFVSQQEDSPSMKMVAAMRNQFGGHALRTIESSTIESIPGCAD
ncbi:MAG: decarboxylating 6-phosphogluconate dehydrogenase [Micropruina sp.]|nr:decarboxylating 6-phosphogluconate dehydrogenase [Micropruina sp.]